MDLVPLHPQWTYVVGFHQKLIKRVIVSRTAIISFSNFYLRLLEKSYNEAFVLDETFFKPVYVYIYGDIMYVYMTVLTSTFC